MNYIFLKAIGWCWIAFMVVWFIGVFFTKRTAQTKRGANRLIDMILVLLAAWLLLNNSFGAGQRVLGNVLFARSSATSAIGLVITLVGLALALWARFTLGKNWSGNVTFKENHELIQSGPYSFVRHPIYTALLLMFLGTAVAMGTLGAFISIVLLFASFWIKLKQEEAVMLEHFPNEYPGYIQRVKRIIPWVF